MIDELPDDRLDDAAALLSGLTMEPPPASSGEPGDFVVSVRDARDESEIAARAEELLARRAGPEVAGD
ncbi:hypothetical protein GTS_22950 [Gandjariella thermophila]|uniref:Uncharacterized protein n=2 Tax=Gandjariella thermophila TaxID=1931992 RepID=A0A4D4J6D2_9PSEU|nr:hypothetical protein GTS_22950 [Gandjariella thermophila]